ncbi:MAG: C40 family peptidase [Actinomycetes bacterium]
MNVRPRVLTHRVPFVFTTAALSIAVVAFSSSITYAWSPSHTSATVSANGSIKQFDSVVDPNKASVEEYLSDGVQSQRARTARALAISDLEIQLAAATAQLASAHLDSVQVLKVAARYKGVHYIFGGTTPSGFDCSGYTQFVYNKVGVSLPRVAQAQYNFTTKITRSQAQPGDLVFFHGVSGVYHVGIYAGSNTIWHAPRTGKSVEKVKLWTTVVTYGRIPQGQINAATNKKIKRIQKALKVLRSAT